MERAYRAIPGLHVPHCNAGCNDTSHFLSNVNTEHVHHEDLAAVCATCLAERQAVRVGDIVRVGKGTKVWRVASFWGTSEHLMADLTPTEGYSRSSALISRLTVVERAPEERHDGP